MREGAKLVSLEPRHAAIVPYLRKADREEILASSGVPIDMAVAFSIAASSIGWAVELHDRPVAIFGARNAGNGRGEPWLVASDVIERYPVHFYRVSRDIIERLRRKFARLENRTDARNLLSLRWLAWAGFEIDPPEPWGPEGFPFHRFWWEKRY